jgi:hypothetical protein
VEGSPAPQRAGEESRTEYRVEDDIAFAGWSAEDLRIADKVSTPVIPDEERAEEQQTASGSRVSWRKAPHLVAASGAFAYEVASNALPGVPGWVWATAGGILAVPEVFKAFKAWLRGEDSSHAD